MLGCSQARRPEGPVGPRVDDRPVVRLEGLSYFDMYSRYAPEVPLMCIVGGDYPSGSEMLFRNDESSEFVHAVFPEAVTPPKTLDGVFILHGHYQCVQKSVPRKSRHKRIPAKYRYFVVSSWERERH